MAMDLEKAARDLVRSCGIECEFYVPDPAPETFATVKRTTRPGSTRFMGRAMITVQGWGPTRGTAERACTDAVDAIVGRGRFVERGGLAAAEDNVTSCVPENGPYRFDDPDVKDRRRWQATVAVDYNA